MFAFLRQNQVRGEWYLWLAQVLLIIQVHMNYVCRYLFLRFKDSRKYRQINPSQTLMNLQYVIIFSFA